MPKIKTFLAVLVGLRAGWACFVWLSGVAVHFDWHTPLSGDSYFAGAVLAASPAIFLLWTSYVAGYVLSAILVWRSMRLAVWVYGASMLVDLGLWVSAGLFANYDLALDGRASVVDMIFNIVDVAIFLGLMVVVMAEARRTQNAPYLRGK